MQRKPLIEPAGSPSPRILRRGPPGEERRFLFLLAISGRGGWVGGDVYARPEGVCWPCAEGAGINGNRRRSPPSVRPVLRGVEPHGQWRCWTDDGDLVSYLRRDDHAPDRWP